MTQIKIQAIVPPESEFPLAQLKKVEQAVQASLKGPIKGSVMNAMKRRVANWKNRPFFRSRFSKPPDTFGQLFVTPVGTNKNKWVWVSKGTSKTPRVPRRSRFMVFRPGYISKTAPGNVYGRSSRRYGALIRRTMVVTGIAARDFEEHIVKERESRIEATVRFAVERALL